jgi:hypothetical protein
MAGTTAKGAARSAAAEMATASIIINIVMPLLVTPEEEGLRTGANGRISI